MFLMGPEAMAEPSESPDAILRRLLRENDVEVQSVRPARGGMEHHLFHVVLADGQVRYGKVPVDGYVDPKWPGRDPLSSLCAEAEAIALVAEKCREGLGVPQPYQILLGEPPGALMGVLPGGAPEQILLKKGMDLRLLRAICHEMGRMLADIHRVKRPADGSVIPDLPGADLTDARLLHMDFHMGNVVGTLQLGFGWRLSGIVDWTCAHWGPREQDVAEMGASLFATNPDMLDEFLLGYKSRTGIGMNRPRVLDVLVLELERRLRDDPPTESRIRNAWGARVEEWSREI